MPLQSILRCSTATSACTRRSAIAVRKSLRRGAVCLNPGVRYFRATSSLAIIQAFSALMLQRSLMIHSTDFRAGDNENAASIV